MQAGIFNADYVTTVSPTYAKEIQTSEGGFGLDGLLRVINSKLSGILNGVDTNVWNPKKDTYICKNFSINSFIIFSQYKSGIVRRKPVPARSRSH